MRGWQWKRSFPDFAALNPGYACSFVIAGPRRGRPTRQSIRPIGHAERSDAGGEILRRVKPGSNDEKIQFMTEASEQVSMSLVPEFAELES
jgi:hypothetical protein